MTAFQKSSNPKQTEKNLCFIPFVCTHVDIKCDDSQYVWATDDYLIDSIIGIKRLGLGWSRLFSWKLCLWSSLLKEVWRLFFFFLPQGALHISCYLFSSFHPKMCCSSPAKCKFSETFHSIKSEFWLFWLDERRWRALRPGRKHKHAARIHQRPLHWYEVWRGFVLALGAFIKLRAVAATRDFPPRKKIKGCYFYWRFRRQNFI